MDLDADDTLFYAAKSVEGEPMAAAAAFTSEVWNNEAGHLGRAIVLAAAVVRETDPDLVNAVADWKSTAKVDFAWLQHDLAWARRRCELAAELLESAAARLNIALAAASPAPPGAP